MQQPLKLTEFHDQVSPGDDFFEYINHQWLQNNPIPDDDYRWSAFNEIQKSNELKLKDILEELADNEDLPTGSNRQKLRDFYNSFMNETQLNQLATQPLQPWLQEINNLTDVTDIPALLAKLHRVGVNVFWGQFVASDDKQSDVNVYRLWQGGLGLPDRDYYFKDDSRSQDIVTAYKHYIAQMAQLGSLSTDPNQFAEQVFAVEQALAEKSLNSEQLRDYESLYHKLAVEELRQQIPGFAWDSYFTALGLPKIDHLIVSKPEFVGHAVSTMGAFELGDIKSYISWRTLSAFSAVLSEEIAQERFNFYDKLLTGSKTIKPRWRRAVQLTDAILGEALGEEFVQLHFNEQAKARMSELVDNLAAAFAERIKRLDWMTEGTKTKALSKLAKMSRQIGYPEKWKDYSALEVQPGDLFGNFVRAQEFEFNRDLAKIGQPVDKMEWHMSPPTVNAYCSFWFNQIVFPAGILQPVFFDPDADDAVNYGGIGVVIGHEITHGFDDQGRKYDENGNLHSWWSEDDQVHFTAKAKKVSELYSGFEVAGGYKVNGELTLGENIADIGGLAIAFDALQIALEKHGRPEPIEGLTPEQRFFASYARVWRSNITDEGLEKQVKTDPHSPARWRVNGALMNIDEFYQAFEVTEKNKLYRSPEYRAQVW